MSKRGDIEFLSDIKEAIKRIEEYTEKIVWYKSLQREKVTLFYFVY